MKRLKGGFYGMIFFLCILIGLILFLFLSPSENTASEKVSLPILLYQDVASNSRGIGEYVVSVQQLEADLRALHDDGWQTVSLQQVLDFVYDGKPLPKQPILLVFDDAYSSFRTKVLPLLEKYDACAVVSVIGACAQRLRTDDAYMSWRELTEVVDSGRVEVQSHTALLHTYQKRKGLQMLPGEGISGYTKLLTEDLKQMEAWAKKAGVPLQPSLAYPYGLVEPLAERILEENGYLVTMTSTPFVNELTRNPGCLHQMGRFPRSGLLDTQQILAWITGA